MFYIVHDNDLLYTPGWKQLKLVGKRKKVFTRMVNQTKLLCSFNTVPWYKIVYKVSRSYEQGICLDETNNNTKWQDSAAIEREQINDYHLFIDKGHCTKSTASSGFQMIRVHIIFDVKQDRRHKAR